MNGSARYVSYYYDDAGNLWRLTHADGANIYHAYDALGRMTSVLESWTPGNDDYIVRYTYKPDGMRQSAIRGAGAAGFATTYHYDAALRPDSIANDLPGSANDVTLAFAYNAAGQIVSRSVSNDAYAAPASAALTRDYQVNGLNQYGGTSSGGVGTASYQYDPNGNLTLSASGANGTTNYTYDVENRLVGASGATSATLVYDPLGRLFSVSSAATGTTQFLYDGDALIGRFGYTGQIWA
jgi:YD repeat-containing protein